MKVKGTTKTMPVEFETASGEIENYEIREMTAAVRDEYMNTLRDRFRLDPQGNLAGVQDYDGMQSDLLSRCLYKLPEGTLVDVKTLDSWPASTVAALFREAEAMHALPDDPRKKD